MLQVKKSKSLRLHSRHLSGASGFLAVASVLVLFAQACIGSQQRMIAKSVLDVAQTACVLVDDHTDDEHALARACDIAEEYIPDVRILMQAKKQAVARKAALAADAGMDMTVCDSRD